MDREVEKIAGERILSVLVRGRQKTYFAGNVKAVSSVNKKGPFDILPLHENFITLIAGIITIRPSMVDTKIEVPIIAGVLKVKDNKVEIYISKEK